MSKSYRIPLGSTVRDCITEIVGVVTGRADYITGCDQYLVQTPTDKDGKKGEAYWLDDQRLIVDDGRPRVEIPDQGVDEPGACGAAPKK